MTVADTNSSDVMGSNVAVAVDPDRLGRVFGRQSSEPVRQLSAASGVGMIVDSAALPISAAVRRFHQECGGDAVDTALTGGDDYELVFTVRPAQRGRLRGVRLQAGDLPITRIGVVTADKALLIQRAHGMDTLPQGFEHFR